MLSKETAIEVAYAYREIETAEKLLEDIREAMNKDSYRNADIRDAFGRRQDGLQLGVPSGQGGHRLFNVPFALAEPVIKAHIAHHQSRLSALSIAAGHECAAQGIAARSDETPSEVRPEGQEPDPQDAPQTGDHKNG